jgi:hypothetical protein
MFDETVAPASPTRSAGSAAQACQRSPGTDALTAFPAREENLTIIAW